jgi:site-specific DNA-methyltransferase (adenine-specific)
MNRLYFGDNLAWLRNAKEFPDASVDLVYLDPPFNSNADYNVLFRETSGEISQAQFHAFTDTWSWADAAETYHQFIDNCPNVAVVEMMEAFHRRIITLTQGFLLTPLPEQSSFNEAAICRRSIVCIGRVRLRFSNPYGIIVATSDQDHRWNCGFHNRSMVMCPGY